jgi:hypothetical protein
MSQRTESSEFAPGFLWQISLLTLVMLGILFLSRSLFDSLLSKFAPRGGWIILPWFLAVAQTLRNALVASYNNGTAAMTPALLDSVRVLSALLFAFVICPTIFLLGWRRRRLDKEAALGTRQLRVSSVLYAFTCVVSLFFAVSIIPISIASESGRQSARERWPAQFSRDRIMTEIQLLAVDTYQYRLVPRDLNGGGGSYRGYRLRDDFSKTQNATYSVTVNDDEVTIHAQSIMYPTASVEVKVDSIGRLVWWKYGGGFEY